MLFGMDDINYGNCVFGFGGTRVAMMCLGPTGAAIDVELKALVQHRPVVNYFRRCRGLQEIQTEVVSQTSKPDSKTESKENPRPPLGQPG